MGIELDLALYTLSLLLLGVYSGSMVALEILSLSTSDRSAEEEGEDAGFVERLLEDPVRGGMALALARALAAALVVAASLRLSIVHLFAGGDHLVSLASLVVIGSLIVPVLSARLLAVRGADRFAVATHTLTWPTVVLLRPVAGLAGGVLRRVSPGLARLLAFQTIPLKEKIEVFGVQNGEPPDEEQKLMESILDFGETRVREVMVPRIDIVAVNAAMDKDEAVGVIMEAGHSRVPVYEETIDRIVGTIYTKDLLNKIVDGEEFSITGIAREPFFVPESKKIDELLSEFRARKQHLAIVVDEYGGTAGIVTLEDVLEEIVGDIQDEFDSEEALVQRLDDDSAVCNAKVHLDDLSEELGIAVPEDSPDSLGGLLYQMIGRVPRVGDRVSIQGIEFEIQSVERQRIDKVLIRGLSSSSDAARDGAA